MGIRGRRPAAPKPKSQPRRGRTAGPPSPIPREEESVSAAVTVNEPRAIEVEKQSVTSSLTNIARENPEFEGSSRPPPLVRAISPDIKDSVPRKVNKRKTTDAGKNNPKTRKSNLEAPEPRDRNSVYQLEPTPHSSATPTPDPEVEMQLILAEFDQIQKAMTKLIQESKLQTDSMKSAMKKVYSNQKEILNRIAELVKQCSAQSCPEVIEIPCSKHEIQDPKEESSVAPENKNGSPAAVSINQDQDSNSAVNGAIISKIDENDQLGAPGNAEPNDVDSLEIAEPKDIQGIESEEPMFAVPQTVDFTKPEIPNSEPVHLTEPESEKIEKIPEKGVSNLAESKEIATVAGIPESEVSEIPDHDAVDTIEPESEEIGQAPKIELKLPAIPEQGVSESSTEFNGFQSASTMPSIRGFPDLTDIVTPLSPNETLSNTESNEMLGTPEDVTAIQRDVPAEENDADIAAAAEENSSNLAHAKNDSTQETEPRLEPSTFIKTTIEVQGSTRQAVINRQISAVVQEFENIGNTTQFRQVLPAPPHATGQGSDHNLNNWMRDPDMERMMTLTQNLVRAAESVRFIRSTGQGSETAAPLVEMEQMVSQMLQELESIAVPARYTEANQRQRLMTIKIESSSEDEEV